MLDEIDSQAESPRQGVELVAAFIQTDKAVLGRADDSDGSIGDVYRIFASESFTSHASQCEDKEWLYDLTLKLYMQGESGVRDSVIANAAVFLPVAGHLHIAEAYHESGFALIALQWLDKVPPAEMFQLDERERLLLTVLMDLGDRGRAEEVAWRVFRRSRSKARLSLLLNVIGDSDKERLIDSEIAQMLESPTLDYVDGSFMLELERFAEAERYLTERSAQLNGDYYYELLPWAKAFEKQGRFLVASVLYRALLDSILRRATSKYYTYAVRYLRKLDDLGSRIRDWGGLPNHDEYRMNLRLEHKLKRSFWARYEP